MTTIDDKIVYISLNTKDFEEGTKSVLKSIDDLKAGMQFKDAGKGLSELNKHVNAFSIAGIAENVKNISSHFSALGAIGFSVLNTLTNGALHFGKAMVDKVLAPIIEGGKQRALNIENAKFQFRALGQNVDKMMASSLAAVKGTAYGLDEAAKAAGQFGAAGINAGSQMTSTLRGVAGIAAVTNSSFSDISQIFTTMAGTGKINSEQLYQFATRGLNVAAALAKQWNTTETHVRQLASQGKISFKQFAGAMDDAFGAHAKEANQTFTGSLKNMQAALARIGADFWTPLLKSQRNVFNALTPFFDKVHEAIMPLIDLFGKTSLANADRFVKMINGIDLTGLAKGMPNIAAGIKNILTLIRTLVTPLKEAFRDIFPPTLASSFVNLTKEFKKFTATLKPSPATLENLRRTFAGLFAILDIGKQILSGIFTIFGQVFGVISDGSGSFLNFTGSVGDWLVAIDKALKEGGRLHNFFSGLGAIIAAPIRIIEAISHAITNMFAGFTPGIFSGSIDKATKTMTPFAKAVSVVGKAFDKLLGIFGNLGTIMQPVLDAMVKFILGIGPAISKTLANANFQGILDVIRTGLLGGLVVMFKQFLGRGSLIKQLTGPKGFVGGIAGNISKTFAALSGSMRALQQNIKAKTLKEIAIAVALLTASVVALSLVDPNKLQGALAAMTIGFGELVGTMYALNKITSTFGVGKMIAISGALMALAFALDLLSLAVIALSRLSWQELVKGLGGVAAMLGILIVAIKPLTANSKGLIGTGIGLIAVATGLRIMANAVAAFGGMNLETLGKGLASVAIGLGILALGMRAMPKGMIAQSAALLGIAIALRTLANVVEKLGGMSLNTIGKGMLGIAGALVIIAGAMHIMPKGMLAQAAALFIVATAIGKIANAVMAMGGMSISQIAKGLITLAGALAILAAGLYVMEGAMGGAAALALAAVGVSLMAGALVKLGKLSWQSIIKGLVALAAVFALIGAAGMLLTPAIPTLLGFGAALILIGAGLALAGAGLFLVSAALSLFVVSLTTAVSILDAGMIELEQSIVNLAKSVALGLLEILKGIAATAPQLVAALIKIISSLLDGIILIAPKVAEAIMALVDAIVKIVGANDDKLVAAGMNLIIALLKGIGDHIGEVVNAAVGIITQFIQALATNMNKLVAVGLEFVVSLYSGIIKNYGKIITAGISIVTKFVGAIANNIGKIVTAGASIITKLISGISKAVGGIAIAGVQAVTHFATGMGKAAPQLITAATNMIIKIMNALSKNSVRLADAGAKAVINFLNGMAKVLKTREPELMAAGFNIGVAIIQGMLNGLTQKGTELLNKAKSIGDGVVKLMKRATGSKSPSVYTHEIGMNLIQGLMNGMDSHSDKLYSAAEDVSNGLIDTFKDVFQITSPSKVMMELGKFVGQGFAKGLRGSTDDINKAFGDLNKQLTDAMATARATISSEQKKLAEERKATKPDAAAIRAAQKTIKENQTILERSRAAHTMLIKSLQDEKKELLGLAKQFDDVTNKIKDAQTALADAIKTRDDAITSFGDKYATLPDVVTTDAEGHAIDQLATYEEALAHQAAAVGAYHSTLDQLRKLGLDDATYQKLLDEGTADQQFADQLLSGGKTAVDGLNKLDSDLQNVSKTLAINAGNNLYQAGVDSAKGYLAGLESQASVLNKSMEKIATAMIKALKKKLKIKSPSQAFAEIGQFSMEGMAQGFTDSSKLVTDSIEGVSDDALAAMQKSMQGISEIVTSELDLNPTISPVLDLTQVRSQSEELAALTAPSPITPAASTVQASAISAAQTTAQADQTNIAPGGTSVKFEQNNYSPEALTEIEIYRQTKNQLSQIKSVLALT